MIHFDLAASGNLNLITALLMGLMGSTHCVGMCGGMAGALSLPLSKTDFSTLKKLSIQFCFSLGRLLGYGIAGYIAGSFSWVFLSFFGEGYINILRITAGIFMIFVGLFLANWWNGLARLESLGLGLWQKISPIIGTFTPADTLNKALVIGFLWGWLPCGLVYSMLVFSISSGNGIHGAGMMLMFGLGTMPAVIGMGMLAEKVMRQLQRAIIKNFMGVMVIVFGLWTIWVAVASDLHALHA